MQRNPIQPLWWAITSKNVIASRNDIEPPTPIGARVPLSCWADSYYYTIQLLYVMNSNDCVTQWHQSNHRKGTSATILRVDLCRYSVLSASLHSAVSAFCVLAKGSGQAMRPISVPPHSLAPRARALAAPSHSTRTSGYCVVVAPRLGYNTGPINLRLHIDVLQWRLPTTVTAGQTIRLNHDRAAALPSTLRTPRRVSAACTSTLL